jgi:hypothetical protein
MYPESEPPKIDVASLNFTQLGIILKDYGHSITPFLRKEYSPYSARPTIDYSMWLYYRFLKEDYQSVNEFVDEVSKYASHPLGSNREDYWQTILKKIIELPEIKLFRGLSSKAIIEIKVFLLLGHFLNIEYMYSLGGIISAVILPYNYSMQNISLLNLLHDKYLEWIRTFAPDFDNIKFDLSIINKINNEADTKLFLSLLETIQSTQRIFLFFDTPDSNKFTNTITFWKRSDFIKNGIYVYEYHYNYIVDGMAKYEIEEVLSKAEIPFRKSSKKKELENILLEYPNLLDSFVRERKVFCINPIYEHAFESANILIKQITFLVSSWLLFTFKKDWNNFAGLF